MRARCSHVRSARVPTNIVPYLLPLLFGPCSAGLSRSRFVRQCLHHDPRLTMTLCLAQNFYSTFSPSIPSIHHTTLHHLSTITLPYHVQTDEVAQRFRSEKYTVRMSRSGFSLLIGWLTEGFGGEPTGMGDGFSGEKGKRGRAAVMRVVNNHLRFDGISIESILRTIANSSMQLPKLQPRLCLLEDGRSLPASSPRSCHRRMGAMWMQQLTTRPRASSSSVLPRSRRSSVQRLSGQSAIRL